MLVSDLDYHLPQEAIAQEPAEPRDAARLLVLHRGSGALEHRVIRDLPQLLREDDLLVFNDTRVLRARLHGRKSPSGGHVEALLLREIEPNLWEALLKPSARLRPGTRIEVMPNAEAAATAPAVIAEVVQRSETGWRLRFEVAGERQLDLRAVLPLIGEVPLPPYIKKPPRNEAQYQTTFARPASAAATGEALDSAAAPTAGLHFTPELLTALHERGIATAFVTLGVGVGTFRPIQTDIVEEHVMHTENFVVPEATAAAIARQKRLGRRVVAVGTTTTRVLEAVAADEGTVTAGLGSTSIFIRPGYQFRCIDALLTNFHLPRSTLLAMVGAFAENTNRFESNEAGAVKLTGLEKIRYAYSQALEHRYRFFSFGDAMLIL
jgi:S-adenosylmethionine:tRNA ribosyltransferase-isomerase